MYMVVALWPFSLIEYRFRPEPINVVGTAKSSMGPADPENTPCSKHTKKKKEILRTLGRGG